MTLLERLNRGGKLPRRESAQQWVLARAAYDWLGDTLRPSTVDAYTSALEAMLEARFAAVRLQRYACGRNGLPGVQRYDRVCGPLPMGRLH